MNNLQSKTILIVDDEKAILKLLSRTLQKNGYKVDIAKNGEEGIKKIKSNDYG